MRFPGLLNTLQDISDITLQPTPSARAHFTFGLAFFPVCLLWGWAEFLHASRLCCKWKLVPLGMCGQGIAPSHGGCCLNYKPQQKRRTISLVFIVDGWMPAIFVGNFWYAADESETISHAVVSDLCDPMDCSLPGSSVHGILQKSILEWVAISYSRGSSWSRDRTQVSCTVGRFFTVWATREADAAGERSINMRI